MREKKNVIVSVLARLHNSFKVERRTFQQVIQQYAMERFLYRVSRSKHAQSVGVRGRPGFAIRCTTIRPSH